MLLLVCSLTLAVASLVSVTALMSSFSQSVNKSLDEFGYNIVVAPKNKQLNLVYGDMVLGQVATKKINHLNEADLRTVQRVASSQARAISEKLLQAAEIKGRKVLLAGVNLPKERKIKHWWQIEAGRFPRHKNEVLVGLEAAEKLGLQSGQTFTVKGQQLKVAGILMATGGQDDSLILVPLATVRAIYNLPKKLSLVEVQAKKTELVDGLAAQLKTALPQRDVKSIKQALKFKANAMGQITKFGLAVTAIVLAISGLVVFSVMASAVNERRREIGVFRAVGFKQRVISQIVLTEVISLSIAGGVFGYLFGMAVVKLLPLAVKSLSYSLSFSLSLLGLSLAMAVIIGLIAGLIPALRAARLEPVEALKNL